MLNVIIVIINCQASYDQYVILRRIKTLMDYETKNFDSINNSKILIHREYLFT
jgi:hypothetical protein